MVRRSNIRWPAATKTSQIVDPRGPLLVSRPEPVQKPRVPRRTTNAQTRERVCALVVRLVWYHAFRILQSAQSPGFRIVYLGQLVHTSSHTSSHTTNPTTLIDLGHSATSHDINHLFIRFCAA